MGDEIDQTICPDCDEPYEKLGLHWAASKDCTYPVLTPSEEAILDGLLFVGGTLNNRHRDANCYVSIVHHDRAALEWIAEQLGVIAASITQFDQAGSIDYYGDAPNQSLWEFRTRSLPTLSTYVTWYDPVDKRTVPDDVQVRPLMLTTACLLAARPMDDRPGLYLSLRRTSPPPVTVHRVFGGYGPRIIRTDDGGYVVRIQNSTDLCNDLAPWPAFARDCFDASQFNEGRIACPRCGGRFRTRTHLCEYVADGEVVLEEDASPGGSRELITVEGMRAQPQLVDLDEVVRYEHWDREECRDALLEEYGSADAFPPNEAYERARQGRDDLPSLSTLYRRFGERAAWLQAMESQTGQPGDSEA